MQEQRIDKYNKYVVAEDFLLVSNYNNIMEFPAFLRVVINTTSKEYLTERKQSINALAACFLLSGQKSPPTRARKSIAGFKLREGALLGCRTTLRKKRLYTIIDKLLVFALPRLYSTNGNKVTSRLNKKRLRGLTPLSSNRKQSFTFSALKTPREGQIYHFANLFFGIKDLLLMPELQEFLPLFESVRGINLGISFSNPRIKGTSLLADFFVSIQKKKGVLKSSGIPELFRHSQKLTKDTNDIVEKDFERLKQSFSYPSNRGLEDIRETNCLLTLPLAGSTTKKRLDNKSWYGEVLSQEWTEKSLQSLVFFEKIKTSGSEALLLLLLERGISQNQNLKNELIHYTSCRFSEAFCARCFIKTSENEILLFEEKENQKILFLTSFQYPELSYNSALLSS
jgi:hypothetical protein